MRAFLIVTIMLNAVCALQVSLPSTRKGTTLYFQLPNFGAKDENENNDSSKSEKKSIGLSGLIQVITAGMGAPFLGDFEGVEEETGKFMFSLEANNLVDEKGNSKQTQMPYFESGWVDPEDLRKEEERKSRQGSFKFPWN